MLLCNAFSLQMLPDNQASDTAVVLFRTLDIKDVKRILFPGFTSAIGHKDTATVLSSLLGVEVACNRVDVSLPIGHQMVVAQLIGGRLPEGATTLPEGCTFKFFLVTNVTGV